MKKVLLWIALFIPLNVPAAENVMINADIKEIKIQKEPAVGMSFTPGVEPGAVISLPDGSSPVIPGYRVRFKDVAYLVGVSCEANLSDDCSAYPYAGDYQDRVVHIRYIQTSDRKFSTPEGSAVGDRWDQTIKKVGGDQIIFTANDSCVRLPSGWHACIDPMSVKRKFDPQLRRLMPKKSAKINFYYKSQNQK